MSELELDVAGVRRDVAKQRLHRRVVGVRRQSERLCVGGRVAQQFSRMGRLDRGEPSGAPDPVEERFQLPFIDFPEQGVLDAETEGVHQKGAHNEAA